jgi:hypothetical protein
MMKEISAILPMEIVGSIDGNDDTEEVTMVTKTFNLKDFTKIEVGGAFKVDIVRSDSFKVTVDADDLRHIRVETVGDTLVIRRQGIEWFAPFHGHPMATVTLPALKEMSISGASHGKLENFQSDEGLAINLSGASHLEALDITTGRIEVKVTGASSLNGKITATKDAKIEASGASKIDVTGTGANMVIKVTGASKAELGKFPVQNADVEVTGASNAFINLNGKLNADVSGASNLYWSGSPVMGDIQTSGASNLRRK